MTGPCFQVNFLLPYSLLWSRPNKKIIGPCIVVILAGDYDSQRKLGNMSTDKLQNKFITKYLHLENFVLLQNISIIVSALIGNTLAYNVSILINFGRDALNARTGFY